MGIIIRQSIGNSIISYVGIALGLLNTLYFYPNILSKEQLGLVQLLLAVSMIFVQFVQLGIVNTVIKFFPKFREFSVQNNGFLFLSLLIPTIGLVLFSLAFPFIREPLLNYYSNSPQFQENYLFILPLIFGLVFFNVLNSYSRALNKSIPGSFVSEVYIRIGVISLLIALYLGIIDFYVFLIGFTLCYVSQFLIMTGYLAVIREFNIKPNFKIFDKNLLNEISNYSFYSFFGGINNIIVSRIDIIMISAIMGLADTAVYTIAFYVGNVIMVPQKSIGKIAPSLISKYLHENNIAEVARIYRSSSINQFIPGCLFFIGIWANLDNLLDILPDDYRDAGLVILIIGASRLINMVTGLNGVIITNSKFYRFNLLATTLLIVFTVLTNYLLIPLYGIVGAALATVISLFLYNFIKFIFVWLRLSMQPLKIEIIYVLIISAAILFLSLQVPRIGGLYIDILIRSATITILFFIGIIGFNISEEITKLWKTAQQRIQSFINN